MWVEETKKGKYKYIERYTDPLTGKYRRVSVVLDKNTAQARKQAQAALSEKIQRAIVPQPETITLAELVEKYRAEQKKTVKPSTYRRNYFFGESVKKVFGSDSRIEAFTANYIRESIISLDKTPDQKNELLKRLKSILRWGYTHDYVGDISYLDKIERFKTESQRSKIEDKFLESEEVTTLLQGMTHPLWKPVTKILVLSGLRFGELAALKREDVDTKDRVIHVRATYDANNKLETTPKTAESARDVYMQDELLDVIRHVKAAMLSQQIATGRVSHLFLTDLDGEHIKYYTYRKYFRENALRLIGRDITPHILRHTHASLLMEQGIDIDTISRRLGHSDSKVTKEIYLHVTKKLKEKERDRIREIKIL